MKSIKVNCEGAEELSKQQHAQDINDFKLPVKEFEMSIARRAMNINVNVQTFKEWLLNSFTDEVKPQRDKENIISYEGCKLNVNVLINLIGIGKSSDSKTFLSKLTNLAEDITKLGLKLDDVYNYAIEKCTTMNGTISIDKVFVYIGLISPDAYKKAHAEYVLYAQQTVSTSILNDLTNSINQHIMNGIKNKF